MDGYPGVIGADSTKQQERHYYLLSELQTLVKDLPRYGRLTFREDFLLGELVIPVDASVLMVVVLFVLLLSPWLAPSSSACPTTR